MELLPNTRICANTLERFGQIGAIPLFKLWLTALIPALSCRSCRRNAPFAELVCLSKSSVAEEYYAERSGNRWISE
jgi:hypothetical protein